MTALTYETAAATSSTSYTRVNTTHTQLYPAAPTGTVERMRSGALPLKPLVLLFIAIISLADGGKLDFYQDVDPEPPEEIMYKRIARYLESQNHEPREMRRSRMSPVLPWPYDDYLDYRRQKEKILVEALLENPGLVEVLENQKIKDQQGIDEQWPQRYDNREDYSRPENERDPSFMKMHNSPNIFDDYKIAGYPKDVPNSAEKSYYVPGYPLRFGPPDSDNYPGAYIDAESLLKHRVKVSDFAENRGSYEEEKSEEEPEFTFKFDETKTNDRDGFAIKPNDPRYYDDDDDDEVATSGVKTEETTPDRAKTTESSREVDDPGEDLDDERKSYSDYDDPDGMRNEKFPLMKISMPELHRRAEHDPLVVRSTRMTNNDIYFIAIVAGCSAACMFALVLIALTWCRLQRGAKAAADIEYPAYGVTGPNKDISPSGDQRLAHSAQMYHFQHQKQQIIAMESRTAASRDPGSVSEAESDEENEEGDYTVYECPGLASTGEMEVKNPMFLEDPTPATPPQNHKDEDHI